MNGVILLRITLGITWTQLILIIYNLNFKYIGGSAQFTWVYDCYDLNLTRLTTKKKFITQPNTPNPIHQPLKTDPIWRVGLSKISFGGLVGWLHTPSHKPSSLNVILSLHKKYMILVNGCKTHILHHSIKNCYTNILLEI